MQEIILFSLNPELLKKKRGWESVYIVHQVECGIDVYDGTATAESSTASSEKCVFNLSEFVL